MPRLRRRSQKHRLDFRRKHLVHAGHLHLVVEIAGIAQAADDDRRLCVLSRIDGEIVVGGDLEPKPDRLGDGSEHAFGQLHALFGGEQRVFVVVGTDADDQLVDEMRRPAHNVDVAVGDGIEASGIEAYAQMSNSQAARRSRACFF